MKKILALLIAFYWSVDAMSQKKIEIEGAKGKSYYLQLEWGKMYYEVFGKGDPLLILHGNGGSAKSRHPIIPRLLEDHMVIAVDSRCHGKSDCPTNDLDYFEMAMDVSSLMDELGYEKYSIWGHSDGGILGLILGYKCANQIERMLISGANTRVSGLEPELVQMMSQYNQIPDPMMRKHVELMVNQKEIPMDSLSRVQAKVLLMVGDRDAVQMEHTLEIFRALPKANLCVLPATSHFISSEKPNHLEYWLREFKKPFSAPSTVEIAKKMAESVFGKN